MNAESQSQIRDHANDQALFRANEQAFPGASDSLKEGDDDIDVKVCETANGCYPADPNETGG